MQRLNKKIVIALGGNALGKTAYEQIEIIKHTANEIAKVVAEGYDLVLTHGNGPQVGMINLAMGYSAQQGIISASMPFAECGAMSQGYIGFHLQNALQNSFNAMGIKKQAISLITQVEVSKDDPAFKNPTKPVGMFYTKSEAESLSSSKLYIMVEDSGRGYRRVVPSPKPLRIVEIDGIKKLVDNNFVVICSGGGGIPVINENNMLTGIDAVIDKDFAAAKLAENLNADVLLILTAVDAVLINFNKTNQQKVECMSCDEASLYIEQNQFAKGSMLPKVQAAIQFASMGKTAIIASLSNAILALKGESGTRIYK